MFQGAAGIPKKMNVNQKTELQSLLKNSPYA